MLCPMLHSFAAGIGILAFRLLIGFKHVLVQKNMLILGFKEVSPNEVDPEMRVAVNRIGKPG